MAKSKTITLEDLRLISQALADLKLPVPVEVFMRRQEPAEEKVTDAESYRLAQARCIMRKVVSYYKTRHQEPKLVRNPNADCRASGCSTFEMRN